MSHPFGALLNQHRARKSGLTQAKLAVLTGYDASLIARMGQGKKELTGPSGRERVVRIIEVLHELGALTRLDEANALLDAADMQPLFERQPAEAKLIQLLRTTQFESTSQKEGATHSLKPHNLREQLTLFIGREKEVAELAVRVQTKTARLWTLTGAGGVGKSRLAQQVAAEVLDEFEGGVWLVELASLGEPRLVADTAASTFGLRPTNRSTQDALSEYLRGKHLLLVLDNCEHLIAACAALVDSLLRACAHLHILATSREPLGVSGESLWRVPSLANEEAVHLFVDRARAAKADFTLTEQNATSVVQLCTRLDGIPLAIELAAARLDAFSIEQLVARLNDRFRLLTGGSRTALPRHQTLRASIDWSYGLLPYQERGLLRHVSVFASGWTLEAAEAIYGGPDALDLLARLVHKSFVMMSETPTGARYGLYETIRQYAHEKLVESGEEKRARQRHLDFFTCMAEEAEPHLRMAARRKMWLDRIQADVDNFRAALDRVAHMRNVASGERLINGLWRFWRWRHQPIEGIRWINTVLMPRNVVGDRAYVTGRLRAGFLSFRTGNQVQAAEWLGEALRLARALDDKGLILYATQGLGYANQSYEQAVHLEMEAIRLADELGWEEEKGLCLYYLARQMQAAGEHEQATHMLTEGLNLARRIQDDNLMALYLGELGIISLALGDYDQARAQLSEGISVALKSDDPNALMCCQIELAAVALYQQRDAETIQLIKASIVAFQKTDSLDRIAQCLSVAAGVAQARGELACAVRWLSVVAVIRRNFSRESASNIMLCYAEYERRLPALREVVPLTDFERAWSEGQQMTLAQAVDEVLAMDESPKMTAATRGDNLRRV